MQYLCMRGCERQKRILDVQAEFTFPGTVSFKEKLEIHLFVQLSFELQVSPILFNQ